jgi:hypothetical protein
LCHSGTWNANIALDIAKIIGKKGEDVTSVLLRDTIVKIEQSKAFKVVICHIKVRYVHSICRINVLSEPSSAVVHPTKEKGRLMAGPWDERRG